MFKKGLFPSLHDILFWVEPFLVGVTTKAKNGFRAPVNWPFLAGTTTINPPEWIGITQGFNPGANPGPKIAITPGFQRSAARQHVSRVAIEHLLGWAPTTHEVICQASIPDATLVVVYKHM